MEPFKHTIQSKARELAETALKVILEREKKCMACGLVQGKVAFLSQMPKP